MKYFDYIQILLRASLLKFTTRIHNMCVFICHGVTSLLIFRLLYVHLNMHIIFVSEITKPSDHISEDTYSKQAL